MFSEMMHDYLGVYMDDSTIYGATFETTLEKLKKVFTHFYEQHLSLTHEKYFMMMHEGIILDHHIFGKGIEVDLAKI